MLNKIKGLYQTKFWYYSKSKRKFKLELPFFIHNNIMRLFNKNVIPIWCMGIIIEALFISRKDDTIRLLFKVTEGLNYKELYKA